MNLDLRLSRARQLLEIRDPTNIVPRSSNLPLLLQLDSECNEADNEITEFLRLVSPRREITGETNGHTRFRMQVS